VTHGERLADAGCCPRCQSLESPNVPDGCDGRWREYLRLRAEHLLRVRHYVPLSEDAEIPEPGPMELEHDPTCWCKEAKYGKA
jgi:hypothetical protein